MSSGNKFWLLALVMGGMAYGFYGSEKCQKVMKKAGENISKTSKDATNAATNMNS